MYRIFIVTLSLSFALITPALAADDAPQSQTPASSRISTAQTTTVEATPPSQVASRQTGTVDLNWDYIKGYWTDTTNIITSPFRWNSNDWLKASLIAGTAVVLYTQDENIKNWVQRNKNDTTDRLVEDTKKASRYAIGALAGLGAYGYIAGDDKAKTTFLLSGESFVVTGAFVQVLKRTTGRHRPRTGDPHDTWSGPTSEGDYQSFPSGDASSAFAVASVVASEYDNAIVPPLVYGLSTLIALGRIHSNAHWSSDVFVGSAIGYFTGKAIVASHSAAKPTTVSIAPLYDGTDKGLLVTFRF